MTDTIESLRAQHAELEAALQAGRDLMAIVHGDGGHYREAHGDRKAADDAIAIVSKLRVDLAAERERREAAEAELAAKRGRREDIRANERRALREKLICAALTGMLSNPNVYGAPEHFAGLVIKQADAVLTALAD